MVESDVKESSKHLHSTTIIHFDIKKFDNRKSSSDSIVVRKKVSIQEMKEIKLIKYDKESSSPNQLLEKDDMKLIVSIQKRQIEDLNLKNEKLTAEIKAFKIRNTLLTNPEISSRNDENDQEIFSKKRNFLYYKD